MISVIIPTLNAAEGLPRTLRSLLAANEAGLIREVVVTDGGSQDSTLMIAEAAGAIVVTGSPGRGQQLARGAEAARGQWFLFLHADTVLSEGWEREAAAHMSRTESGRRAAVFHLKFEGGGPLLRCVAAGANLRTRAFRLPYGDQGLLLSKEHYQRVGGFSPQPLFEDVDFVRRLVARDGRGALALLSARAVTSPVRYRRDGVIRRVLRNWWALFHYYRGTPPERLLEIYRGPTPAPHSDGETADRRSRKNPIGP